MIYKAPKSQKESGRMTLDNLERQNRDFYGFLAISSCEIHFKSELRRNQLR